MEVSSNLICHLLLLSDSSRVPFLQPFKIWTFDGTVTHFTSLTLTSPPNFYLFDSFFASGYFRILLIQILIVNRCAAIVAPRNPTRTWATYTASIILRIPLVAYGSWIASSLYTLICTPEEADRNIEEVLFSL